MILGKIKTSKIDKARLFKGKTGEVYLDICLIPTPDNKYGDDYLITQSVSKEERDNGVKGNILGNARNVVKAGEPAAPTPRASAPPAEKRATPPLREDGEYNTPESLPF